MRMSGIDNVDPGCRGIELNPFQIVQHVEHPAAERDEFGVRIVLCPLARIYVSSYSSSRSNPSQSVDHFWSADVPSVDDVIGPCEMLYRLGAQKAVCIGNNADPHYWVSLTRSLSKTVNPSYARLHLRFARMPPTADMIRIYEARVRGLFS